MQQRLRRLRQRLMQAAPTLRRPRDTQHHSPPRPQTLSSLFLRFLHPRRCCFSHFQRGQQGNRSLMCRDKRKKTRLHQPNFQPETCRGLILQFSFPSETHAAARVQRLSPEWPHAHGADGGESEVCFLSCASHLQSRDSSSYFRNHSPQPERVNNILHSASAAKDVTLTAGSFESAGICVCVCVCVCFFFPLLLSASVTVRRAGVGCSRCFALLSLWCVQK